MTTFTHQQVQEILRSGQRLSAIDEEAFNTHLAQCPECQSYAEIVKELRRAVPQIYASSSLSSSEIRQKAQATQQLLRRRSMFTRFMHGTTAFVWLGTALVFILMLGFIVPQLLPTPAKPAVPSYSTATPAALPTIPSPRVTNTAPFTTSPTIPPLRDTPASNVLSTTLQHFPLFPGASWTYSYTDYDPDANDPSKTVQAVFQITRTVTDVKTVSGIYYAHIQNLVKKRSEDPGWAIQSQNPPIDYNFWYIIDGNQIYSGTESDSPENLPKDQLTLEFVLPLAKDAAWCPNPIGKASVDNPATSVPCNPIGKRVVLAETSYHSSAGSYDHCYQMADIYNSGGAIQTFCDGVGLVEVKYDHRGTQFGFLQALENFKPGEGIPSPTPEPVSIQYTVVSGDNVFSIAEKYHLKPETILWANTETLQDNPNNIKPGMRLRIPPMDGLYYRWEPGDTISSVVDRFGVTPQVILTWPENAPLIGTPDQPDIHPGVVLFIPGGKMPLQNMPTAIP